MTDRFEVKIRVETVYELIVGMPFTKFDQREGEEYTDYKDEVHSFVSLEDAAAFVRKNPKAEVKSFVSVQNLMSALQSHTRLRQFNDDKS